MRRSEAFLATSRESTDADRFAVRTAERAGLIRRFGSGLYGFAPVGERVRRKLVARVEREMERIGGQAVSLPQLQYERPWAESGRWGRFEGEMFTFENRDGQAMCLAPSAEEGIVELVDGIVRSYDDLPLLLYQTGTKHRDDHARNGLLRTKEFTMKDAYSLHATEASLDRTYRRVRAAYERAFDAVGVDVAIVEADNSVMGGSTSEEFVAPVEAGSDDMVACTADDCRFGRTDEHPAFDAVGDGDDCPDCGARLRACEGIEVGHVFRLGTRYSEAMDLTVDAPDGRRHVLMGSYGLGVTRSVQTLVEQHADDDGCRWPGERSVAPFELSVIPLAYEGDLRRVADRIHDDRPRETLLFDGRATIGERFAESDLLGVPWKAVLGDHFRATGEVELESRDGDTRYVDPGAVFEVVDG
jgi:prolyl-tRNA synthetase